MKMQMQIACTMGATLTAIGALMVTAPTTTPTEPTYGLECLEQVDALMDVTVEGPWTAQDVDNMDSVMRQACGEFGEYATAVAYEDGSWKVTEPVTGVYWTGCVSTEAMCAD